MANHKFWSATDFAQLYINDLAGLYRENDMESTLCKTV